MQEILLRATAAAALLMAAGCGSRPTENAQQPGKTAATPTHRQAVQRVDSAGLLPPDVAIASDSSTGETMPIVFDTRVEPERLLAWYRSPQRSFRIGSELREGAEWVLSGSANEPQNEFTVRLAPGINGGTSGMVLIGRR